MTVKVTIEVPEFVERIVVQTQSYAAGGWQDDDAVAYGPGTHVLHIWDERRISCIVERPLSQDAVTVE